jgi:pseudouridine-5'-phosphate glycosidase
MNTPDTTPNAASTAGQAGTAPHAERPPHPALTLTEEVREALAAGHPVVALESTIISHGMPYPQNVAMATEVEQIIRDGGAVPATIAVLDGRPRVGLTRPDLELLATDQAVTKVSLRDLPYVVARGEHGATTVAATMRLAALAGIRTFVTGGLGGVHRGAQQSFDISADLTELAQTDVAVVSAGVKSILDIGLTLETLETLGVPVIGYGTDEFPAFFSRRSGFAAPMRADSPAELAAIMHTKWDLGIRGGLDIANPIPAEDEIPADQIDAIIDRALSDMDAKGVKGKDATPFLLGRIVEITGGESLRANIALVKNNARLGARIAAAYAELQRG